ncbi:N-acetylglucosaminyldiphosphoundecaprenol N-acetyl-beta-D-mannosaminyltransferase [Lentibacillus sp. JNUCC-1]|uniref:WecB/TagA/CpsF family glycosyltransferase n=1 Tax=Lentibacillus sp. JNUCC-1 TaxID=2654513 RepID=UPI0012E7DF33|nr:WecB/TagA/CpsF family glycosyltransferase [Lentibacillus sp. JNUCC-1]MUV37295.1 N-acetylglucosaminyldiphosphoundecaprenol N-acetyl-beta-D-mannosaminyltransferase [Lentibacillus sp. JNUCC-1]
MERHNLVPIMGIEFLNITRMDLLEDVLMPRLDQRVKTFLVTANPEMVMQARADAEYKAVVQGADYVIPDGSGILAAGKILGTPMQERIPGYELMMDLLQIAEDKGLSCYFLGAKPEVNEQAVQAAQAEFPGLKVAGRHHGYFAEEEASVAQDVIASQADLIFVALGMPRQEKWISAHMKDADHGLFMGVGGSFDVLAGALKRAPQAWINLNLEWLYRLLKQPSRIKRIGKVFEFMFRIVFRGK